MAYIYIYIYDVYPKIFPTPKKSGKQMAARNSLNVLKYRGLKLECAWRCVSYFHPSVTKKVAGQKGTSWHINEALNQVQVMKQLPKAISNRWEKNMKKTNSLGLKYPKVVASFYIQKFHPEKTLLDKEKRWLKYPPPWKPPTPAWETTIQMSWRVAMRR